ncbi:probable insulin-like peptide 6 [Drosophila teissieri]|uniref:probable insulin-like peptide 6 n=1 Tax=Drosophila teissieri TaxID=7243 RepID=UPI001CBA1282|nr:probable insulin-like peptide 6 [Drosophila teissieri]XP_043658314.1 probable insulin-like peptide 6 [Drosophila teissieri]
MIPEVATTKVLLVLTTVLAVATLISSWVPQVAAGPLPPADYEQKRMMCSNGLSEVIQRICVGGTVALGDNFPNSFGKRRKRDMPSVTDLCCKPGGCSYRDLLNYCKG